MIADIQMLPTEIQMNIFKFMRHPVADVFKQNCTMSSPIWSRDIKWVCFTVKGKRKIHRVYEKDQDHHREDIFDANCMLKPGFDSSIKWIDELKKSYEIISTRKNYTRFLRKFDEADRQLNDLLFCNHLDKLRKENR